MVGMLPRLLAYQIGKSKNEITTLNRAFENSALCHLAIAIPYSDNLVTFAVPAAAINPIYMLLVLGRVQCSANEWLSQSCY